MFKLSALRGSLKNLTMPLALCSFCTQKGYQSLPAALPLGRHRQVRSEADFSSAGVAFNKKERERP